MFTSKEALAEQEEAIRLKVRQLSDEQKKHFHRLTLKSIKDPDTYAVLNWCFIAGFHHFYLGKFIRGAVNLSLLILGLILLFSIEPPWVGLGIYGLVFLLELPQLLNAQNIIHQYNNQLMQACLVEVLGASNDKPLA
ncbi:TM2 domain-containing protein [Shewanella eurypsychrophilus]|uniref:TM2 domain-containing protein n=2 Tax=Shewanella TaxID=22 RepID=A0ABX6VDJ4_9GAMM|nr:TM2 domain-containing protein [Shewanella eurypsychrophilus]QFU25382.1 TM2 domain-containing protein [Shewanella sp. YLB-09]QPG60524.1 TM2 domain-containing protein [Shewanella eurypsychrophilus]